MNTPAIAGSLVALAAVGLLGLEAQRGAPAPDGGPQQASASQAQVSDVRVAHRGGQTFVTWKEIEAPALGAEPTVEAVMRTRRDLEARISYRVYRSTKPIAAMSGLTPIGTTGPLSAWNTDYYGAYPPAGSRALRYAIADGAAPLPAGTGLYVHNPRDPGPAYYAVTAVIGGRETVQLDDGNRTGSPLSEQVGAGVPVLQRIVKPATLVYVENAELRYYTRWESPPNANRENRPIDYLVAIPPQVRDPATVGIHLHSWGASLNSDYGWWYNASRGAILVASNQIPYDWWTGYHELLGRQPLETDAAWSKGVVRPYTQTRLLSFVDWLATTRRIDRTRLFAGGNSMGGSGAIMLAIRHPEIAWAVSWVGVHRPRLSPGFASSYELVYGPERAGVRFEDGTPTWEHYDDVAYLRRHPDRDIGFITFSNGKNDSAIGWPQAVDFVRALQETRQPHLFVWGQAGHGQRAYMPAGGGEQTMALDIRTTQSIPALTRSSLDDNPGNGNPTDGNPEGQINFWLEWDTATIVDRVDRWEMTIGIRPEAPRKEGTVDVTPRRLQQFRPVAGETLRWSNTVDRRVLQSGEVTPDRFGLVTIPGVQIHTGGGRIVVERLAKPAGPSQR